MVTPVWLLPDVIYAVHKRQLAEHGGAEGVRDQGLLDSALARPKNIFAYAQGEHSLTRLAAAYAFGIARNHPFVDGNKRTAFIACMLFLKLNGCTVNATQEQLYAVFISLANNTLSEEALGHWLESVVSLTAKYTLHEPGER